MKLRKRNIILSLVALIVLISASVVFYYQWRQPPLARLHQAMASLEKARSLQADHWAKTTYDSAKNALASGREALKLVHDNWWPFESYAPADSLFSESIRLSQKAIMQSEKKQSQRDTSVSSFITQLSDSVEVWRGILDRSLPRTEDALLFRSIAFNMEMAKRMLNNNQPESAREYADSVATLLNKLRVSRLQHDASSQQWVVASNHWAERTLETSKSSKKTAIIVDKSKHYLYLISAGKIIDSIPCELGYNSGFQKRVKGDGATPEGMYHVTKINKQSKYYLAFLINYPNADDRKRFEANKKAGIIPDNAEMGSLIEIHGHGGTGRDWTDGCVAVTNKQMDRLLKYTAVNTPVTIVRVWERK